LLGACTLSLDVGEHPDAFITWLDAGIDSGTTDDAGLHPRTPRVLVDGLDEDVIETACALDDDGNLHVAYSTTRSVRYVVDRTGELPEEVISGVTIGGRPSIAMRGAVPWVSFVTADSDALLRVAHRDGTWSLETLPSPRLFRYAAPLVATPTGLWLGASSWQTTTNGGYASVIFYQHDGVAFGSSRFLGHGEPQTAAVDSLGFVQFTMYNTELTVPTYVALVRDERSSWVEYQIGRARDWQGYAALVLDANDRPHVLYNIDGGLFYAYAPREGVWEPNFVDGLRTRWYTVGVRRSNTAIIAYYDSGTRDLDFAERQGTTWAREVLDEDGDVGRAISMVVDDADRARIVYYDATRRELRVIER
jgi:hypothetical protein